MKSAKDWLQQTLGSMFQPISSREALRIASTAIPADANGVPLVCCDTKPDNFRIYSTSSEPCWYISAPWNDHKDVLAIRSSRVILVGKLTGTIHYDGPAGDEG